MKRLLLVLTLLVTGAVVGLVPPVAAAAPPATVLDGMTIGHLPGGLGTPSDFTYEFDEVGFVSRVWESRTSEGWQVDLNLDVLRGPRLDTPQALHDWFIAYEERPADEARYVPTTVRGRPGWVCADEVFWFVRPGVAVSVRLDTARWPHRELLRTARSVHGR